MYGKKKIVIYNGDYNTARHWSHDNLDLINVKNHMLKIVLSDKTSVLTGFLALTRLKKSYAASRLPNSLFRNFRPFSCGREPNILRYPDITCNVSKAVTINLRMEGISKYLKELVYGRSQFMHQFPEHPVRPIIPGALTSGGYALAVYSLPVILVLSFSSCLSCLDFSRGLLQIRPTF